jgi:hypothetical protein
MPPKVRRAADARASLMYSAGRLAVLKDVPKSNLVEIK